jgi:deoxyribonuclease V
MFKLINGDRREILNKRDTIRWQAIQKEIANRVNKQDSFTQPLRLIAGVDTAYSGDEAFSAVVVLDYETLELAEIKTARCTVKIPYIPSFLFFREVEPMTKAIAKLNKPADVLLVNAHGIAHPERCGCASHLGIILDIPTIGVANKVLCGKVSDSVNGKPRYLKDGEEIIGVALTSDEWRRPIYVSIGHKVSLDSAIRIVEKTTKRSRMPEPLRLAHVASNEVRRVWEKKQKKGVKTTQGD